MIRYKKFQIRFIDNGMKKIETYLLNLDLIELEIIYEKYYCRYGHLVRIYRTDGSYYTRSDPEKVLLWDREKMIEQILGCYSIIARGGLFDFMEQETKGDLTFGKF